MTEAELELLSDLKDKFWLEFSDLCNRYIAMAPPHLKAHATMVLGDVTSIYGRKLTAGQKAHDEAFIKSFFTRPGESL